MHWRRGRRVADGVDGKTGQMRTRSAGPIGTTVHRAGFKALLAASISNSYACRCGEVGDPAHLPTQRPTVALWAGCDGSGHWIRHAKSAVEHRDA
jgi:hypothetical protein